LYAAAGTNDSVAWGAAASADVVMGGAGFYEVHAFFGVER